MLQSYQKCRYKSLWGFLYPLEAFYLSIKECCIEQTGRTAGKPENIIHFQLVTKIHETNPCQQKGGDKKY